MSLDLKKQSNPFSTGGGGVNFETRVQASFAIALFTQSCIPCLSQTMRAKELKFQNKYDGSHIDDFVLNASDNFGNESKLYAQIKHEISVSEAEDSMFTEVMISAWSDYKNKDFNLENDSIALITGLLSQHDINNTLPILEWARYSSNFIDFFKKIMTKGFTSQAKINRLNIFRVQLSRANQGKTVSDEELWNFLRIFYIVSFDLDTKHSVVAHLLCSLVQSYCDESPSLVFSKIITCVQEFNQNAGILTYENSPNEVRELFSIKSKLDFEKDFLKLQERGNHIVRGISNTIQGLHVDREEYLAKISETFDESNFVFVTGARGSGKSGIVKDFISKKAKDIPVFYLRAEDLDHSHLNDVFSFIGMHSNLSQIEGYFSLLPQKILVIESLEKVLELDHQDAFIDLLQFIRQQVGWTIIATGRDYAFQQLSFNFLQPNGIKFNSVNIKGFSEAQVQQVCEHIPELKVLTSNESLGDILRVPFFIEIAVRAIANGAQFKTGDTENDFRKTVWSSVIAKEQDRKSGMPVKRRKTFIEIATQRAKKMVFGISADPFDSEVISKLEEDNLIYRDQTNSTISLPHDVLEDWALEEFIEDQYKNNLNSLIYFLSAIGSEPAISRAFRLWLYRRLQFDVSTYDFVENILNNDVVESFWKDETIAAILQNDNPQALLERMRDALLKDDCNLLIRFCFILRITCQSPVSRFNQDLRIDEKSGVINNLFLKPTGKGWEALINFIYEVRSELSESCTIHIVELISEWCEIINIYDDMPEESRIVGLLAIWLLEPLKNKYGNDGVREKVISVLLKVSPKIEFEFDQLMMEDVFVSRVNSRRLNYVEQLTSMALVGIHVPMLCKFRPDFIIKLAMHKWLLEEDDPYKYQGMGTDQFFGLNDDRDFFPASGAKGPFLYLLQHHPRKGLDFILDLCNLASKNYAKSDFANPTEKDIFSTKATVTNIEIKLNDGKLINQFISPYLWVGYRGKSTLPYLLQCSLMALENWLIDYVDGAGEKNQISWIYDYLLRNSNSVMITSVLSSVAIGFPFKVNRSAFPILNTIELYLIDIGRVAQEVGGNEQNWFAFNRDIMSEIYTEDRRQAALRAWRKESLETLLTRLQLDRNLRNEVLSIVDNLKDIADIRNEKNLRYLVNRIDTRTWEVIDDKENNCILLQNASDLPDDLKEDQSKFNQQFNFDKSIINLHLWSRKLFEENKFEKDYFSSYSDALDAANTLLTDLENGKKSDYSNLVIGAIATVAAVSIRDELENLDDESIEWCIEIVLQSAIGYADAINEATQFDKSDNWGSGASAFVLSKLFLLDLNEEQKERLKFTLATALTHANLNICSFAAKGVRDFLWSIDSELASNYLAGIVEYAKFRKKGNGNNQEIHYLRGKDLEAAYKNYRKHMKIFRNKLSDNNYIIDIDNIDLENYSSWFIHLSLLMIPLSPKNSIHIALFSKVINFIYDAEYYEYRSDDDRKIHHDLEREIQNCFLEQLIHSRNDNFEPFKELFSSGCLRAPSFIYLLKLLFVGYAGNEKDFHSIWSLWKVMEPELHKIALTDINVKYQGKESDLNRLLREGLFANRTWNGNESEREFLEKGIENLFSFARKSGNNSHVFMAFSSLLYNFYDLFFERGIQLLAEKFTKNSELIMRQLNTSFYLEMSIARYLQVENRGMLNQKMYRICLILLNGIIETGSARAYYLREHLIRSRKIVS